MLLLSQLLFELLVKFRSDLVHDAQFGAWLSVVGDGRADEPDSFLYYILLIAAPVHIVVMITGATLLANLTDRLVLVALALTSLGYLILDSSVSNKF